MGLNARIAMYFQAQFALSAMTLTIYWIQIVSRQLDVHLVHIQMLLYKGAKLVKALVKAVKVQHNSIVYPVTMDYF